MIYTNNPDVVQKVKGNIEEGSDELKRRVCSYFYGAIENELLFNLYMYLLDRELIIDREATPEYDGLCFKPKEGIDYQQIVNDFSDAYFEANNFRMNFKVKEYDRVNQEIIDARMQCDDDDDDDDELDDEEEKMSIETNMWKSYNKCKKWFEKNHFKVVDTSNFYKESTDDDGGVSLVCFSRTNLITSYEDVFFEDLKVNETTGETSIESKSFIGFWISDNKKRKYHRISCFAPPNEPLEGVYNTWRPFRIQTLNITIEPQDEEYVKEGVSRWKNHIFILCGRNENEYNWFLKYLGQMLKYPALKTFCPSLISKEGAGKGTLIKLMRKLMGNSKIFETTNPERDVWGTFNSRMATAFFVILSEISSQVMKGNDGKFKASISDTTIDISGKGEKLYTIPSYHRFMSATNYDNPVGSMSKKDDRRNVLIRSSDELLENSKYFEEMNTFLDDDKINYGVYEFLTSQDGLDTFHINGTIETDYHKVIKDGNRDIYAQFLEDFILDIKDYDVYVNPKSNVNGFVCVESKWVYECYTRWFKEKGFGEKSVSENSFNTCLGIRQKNGTLPEESVVTSLLNGKKKKCFNIRKIVNHLNIDIGDTKPSANNSL